MRLVLALLCASLSCGCAEVSSIYHNRELSAGRTIVVDAKQRAIIAGPATTTREYGADGKTVTREKKQAFPCAEPPPDVFSVLAASAQGNVSYKDIAALSGSYSQSESGASLLTRTTVIQTLRDGFYRLCEAHMSGGMDDVAYTVGLKKFQTELIGLLAIEQLTGAVQSASASIAAASQAQLGSVSALAQQRQAWSLELEQVKAAQGDANKAATATAEAAKAAKKASDDAPTDVTLKSKADDAAADDQNAQKTKAALDAKAASLASSIKAIDDSLKGASAGGTSASAASATATAPPAIIIPNSDNQAKAMAGVTSAVVKIVQAMNNDDYGPTTCLETLRRTANASSDTKCKEVMEAYAASLAFKPAVVYLRSQNKLTHDEFMAAMKAAPQGDDHSGGIRFFSAPGSGIDLGALLDLQQKK